MAMSSKVDRESVLTLVVIAGLFVLAILWGKSAGAFDKPKEPEGPKPPLPPEPTPTPPPEESPLVKIVEDAFPSDAPAWIVEGGAPPSGFEHLAWYTYRGLWIRIEGEPREGGSLGTGWLWWSAYSEATPLATARAWEETATLHADENIEAAAAKAATWVDENLGGSPPVA